MRGTVRCHRCAWQGFSTALVRQVIVHFICMGLTGLMVHKQLLILDTFRERC